MIDLNIILNELNEEDEQKTPPAICYYPGGFKPPHEGHYEVVKDLAARPYVTKVIVLIGHKTRDGITKEQSKRIWDLYLATSPIAKATVRISTDASPIKDIFSAFDDDLELKAYVAGAKNEVEEMENLLDQMEPIDQENLIYYIQNGQAMPPELLAKVKAEMEREDEGDQTVSITDEEAEAFASKNIAKVLARGGFSASTIP